MSWFSRKRKESVAEALDRALDRIFDAQAKQIESVTTFFSAVSEASAKKAAAVLGARGGRRTQQRRRAQGLTPTGACALCLNPSRGDVTIAMIDAHRLHGKPLLEQKPDDEIGN